MTTVSWHTEWHTGRRPGSQRHALPLIRLPMLIRLRPDHPLIDLACRLFGCRHQLVVSPGAQCRDRGQLRFCLKFTITPRLQPEGRFQRPAKILVINEVFSNGLTETFGNLQPNGSAGDRRDVVIGQAGRLEFYQIPAETIVLPGGFHVVPCSLETTGFDQFAGESVFLTVATKDSSLTPSATAHGADHSVACFPMGPFSALSNHPDTRLGQSTSSLRPCIAS